MKVLVTGGAGFIGSHIVDQLISQDFRVIVVDDLSRGKREHIHPAATFYMQDIRDLTLSELFMDEKVDFVVHQAAQIDVQSSLKEPLFDASVNILGTLNLLEASLKSGAKKIIFASSAAIYGEPCYLPVNERHPLKAQSGYGLSKQVAEQYLALYKSIHGLDFTVLRYANVYGPRQDGAGEGGVVAVFTNQLLKGETSRIFGSGEQTRDFIYVEDVARANVLALGKASGLCMNVSTGGETSVNQLYTILGELLDKKQEPVYTQTKHGDIHKSFLANDLIRNALDWKPETGLRDGLKLTLDYQRKNLQQPGDIRKIS